MVMTPSPHLCKPVASHDVGFAMPVTDVGIWGSNSMCCLHGVRVLRGGVWGHTEERQEWERVHATFLALWQ